jgi:hypothetical protein
MDVQGDPKWHEIIHSCARLYWDISKCLTEFISHQICSEKVQNLASQPDVLHTVGQTCQYRMKHLEVPSYYVTDIMKEDIGMNS